MKAIINAVKNIPIEIVRESLSVERHILDFLEVMEDRRLDNNLSVSGYHVQWFEGQDKRYELKGEITGDLITHIFYKTPRTGYLIGVSGISENALKFTMLPLRMQVQILYDLMY